MPNSQLMDKKVMQFDTSCIKFMLENNFDFNKLFKEGLNYTRLSEKEEVKSRIAKSVGEAPEFNRMFTHLGSQSSSSLQNYVKKV